MTLGERIHTLRTARGLSQGDVAEALDVSRQSVSKWETESSVPELEKLLGLSSLFGVTLDELVRGEAVPPAAAAAPSQSAPASSAPQPAQRGARTLIGVLLFASPFLLCGILCLLIRKHTGLWCAWAVFTCVSAYLYFATGITWRLLLMIPYYTASMNYARLVIAIVHLLLTLVLILVTVRRFSGRPLPTTRRNVILLIVGWGAFIGYHFVRLPLSGLSGMVGGLLIFFLVDAPKCALLTALLTCTVRLIRTRRASR